MADVYYPFITVEKIKTRLETNWETAIISFPQFFDGDLGNPKKGTPHMRVVVDPSSARPATTGSTVKDDVSTGFFIEARTTSREDIQRVHYQIRKWINSYQVNNGHWHITAWNPDFLAKRGNHYQLDMVGEERLYTVGLTITP